MVFCALEYPMKKNAKSNARRMYLIHSDILWILSIFSFFIVQSATFSG
jgi:hypothetical protein